GVCGARLIHDLGIFYRGGKRCRLWLWTRILDAPLPICPDIIQDLIFSPFTHNEINPQRDQSQGPDILSQAEIKIEFISHQKVRADEQHDKSKETSEFMLDHGE